MQSTDCPVERYSGNVELPDYLGWEQANVWADTVGGVNDKLSQLQSDGKFEKGESGNEVLSVKDTLAIRRLWVEGICKIVVKWHLKGLPEVVTPDNFPYLPSTEARKLIDWLVDSIGGTVSTATAVPPT